MGPAHQQTANTLLLLWDPAQDPGPSGDPTAPARARVTPSPCSRRRRGLIKPTHSLRSETLAAFLPQRPLVPHRRPVLGQPEFGLRPPCPSHTDSRQYFCTSTLSIKAGGRPGDDGHVRSKALARPPVFSPTSGCGQEGTEPAGRGRAGPGTG